MSQKGLNFIAVAALVSFCATPAPAKTSPQPACPESIAAAPTGEPQANTQSTPSQILRTGIDLSTVQLSVNSMQLAERLHLTAVLQKIEHLRANISNATSGQPVTLETLAARQDLTESVQEGQQIIQEADLAVDFTIAEINAEISVNHEILATYQTQANHAVSMSNWAAYYSNGALWAVAEALDIPTCKRPKYAIGSGINGIIAGVIPSIASLWAMHAANGRKHPGERDPNMLTQLFDLKPDLEDEFPSQVWAYLVSVPPSHVDLKKTRRDQLIDRWVSDKNIPGFTDRTSKDQIELVTAARATKSGITIDLLQTRETMLTQLAAEVMKMKRLLLELSMAVHGEKHI